MPYRPPLYGTIWGIFFASMGGGGGQNYFHLGQENVRNPNHHTTSQKSIAIHLHLFSLEVYKQRGGMNLAILWSPRRSSFWSFGSKIANGVEHEFKGLLALWLRLGWPARGTPEAGFPKSAAETAGRTAGEIRSAGGSAAG